MAHLITYIKPGTNVKFNTPQGQVGSGKVVMNRGTHLVLNAGRGRPAVVTPQNFHSVSAKIASDIHASGVVIDEASKELLQKYLKKAGSNLDQHVADKIDTQLAYPEPDNIEDTIRTKNLKIDQRSAGINTARLKIFRIDKKAAKLKKESLDKPPYDDSKDEGKTDHEKLKAVYHHYPEYHDPAFGGGNFHSMVRKFASDNFYKLHHVAKRYMTNSMSEQNVTGGGLKDYPEAHKKLVAKIGALKKKEPTAKHAWSVKTERNGAKVLTHTKNGKTVTKTSFHSFMDEANKIIPAKDIPKDKYIKKMSKLIKDKQAIISLKKEDSSDAEGQSSRVAKTKKKEKTKKLVSELNKSTLASYAKKAVTNLKDRAYKSGVIAAVSAQTGVHAKDNPFFKNEYDKVGHRVDGLNRATKRLVKEAAKTKLANVSESWSVEEKSHPHYGKYHSVRHSNVEVGKVQKRHTNKGGVVFWAYPKKDSVASKPFSKKSGAIDYVKSTKTVTEGTRDTEFGANLQLAAQKSIPKAGAGHYIKAGSRRLSGPHPSAGEALKAFKDLHPDQQHGAKIVKEGITESKVERAAKKILSLTKKAKNNKHVDTEPTLNVQDKGGTGPVEANHDQQNGESHAKI